MKNLIIGLSFFVCLVFGAQMSLAGDEEFKYLDSTPAIDSWGMDVGFGTQAYMEDVSKVSVFTPFLFEGSHGANWRMSFDFSAKELQAVEGGIGDFSISFENDSPVYKDVVYSFVKFGIGVLYFEEDDFYEDDTVLTLPISLGLQVVTHNSNKGVMSYFLEYKFYALKDYDKDKSLPEQANAFIKEEALFSGITSMGIRFAF